ncbi:PEP-CTERM sorting domain-containing protein [Colwellia sp. BRX8-9]|uniref:PEP-CTERM sorting domain-containing protein n=1 Tax=Colwellia sp. BRX8-9 TaxID=2759831 RepID=UPI002174E804|nr:PEP-CTERM sorting domain-containing protein [Colwellia sp. BRX8-9]
MKFKLLKAAITGATLLVTGFANAGLITNLDGLNGLTADYTKATVGNLTGIPGGSNSFNRADFGTSSDASKDSATFKLNVESLTAFTGNNKFQYLFESGGAGNGIGIYYNAANEITFSQRTGARINTISLDVTSLIGQSFDIVASLSLDDNLMRMFIGENIFSEQALITGSNDWDGGNGGAFGKDNSSLVSENNTGRAFASGGLSGFAYYHDTVVDVPEPTTLAIFALGIMGLAVRRFKKQS